MNVDYLILGCSCSSVGHVVRFSLMDGVAYISVAFEYEETLWGRLKLCWRYLTHRACRYYDGPEIVLDRADMGKLQAWVDRWAGRVTQ